MENLGQHLESWSVSRMAQFHDEVYRKGGMVKCEEWEWVSLTPGTLSSCPPVASGRCEPRRAGGPGAEPYLLH